MPLKNVRYRVVQRGGEKIRLAFRGKGKVVEAKKLPKPSLRTRRMKQHG